METFFTLILKKKKKGKITQAKHFGKKYIYRKVKN